MDGIKDLKTTGDSKRLMLGLRQLGTTMTTYLGVGLTTQFFRNMLTRRRPRDDEVLGDKMFSALEAMAIFGPVTRMLLHKDQYSSTTGEWFLGLMPKVKGALDAGTIVYDSAAKVMQYMGYDWETKGPYGELSPAVQIGQFTYRHFGLARSVVKWYEHIAYPYGDTYFEARNESFKFQEARRGRSQISGWKANAVYYDIRQSMRRGDWEGAVQDARTYYKNARARGMRLADARKNLRLSLMQGRPLRAAAKDFMALLRSIPEGKRAEMLRAHRLYMRVADRIAPTQD